MGIHRREGAAVGGGAVQVRESVAVEAARELGAVSDGAAVIRGALIRRPDRRDEAPHHPWVLRFGVVLSLPLREDGQRVVVDGEVGLAYSFLQLPRRQLPRRTGLAAVVAADADLAVVFVPVPGAAEVQRVLELRLL